VSAGPRVHRRIGVNGHGAELFGHVKVATLHGSSGFGRGGPGAAAGLSHGEWDSPSVAMTLAWCRGLLSMLTSVVCSGRNRPPLVEGPERCQAQGPTFVGGGGEPEQQLGAGVVQGAEADLVHDDEVVAQQSVDDLADGHDVCWATDLADGCAALEVALLGALRFRRRTA